MSIEINYALSAAYRRIKTKENSNAAIPKSSRSRLREVILYERFQLWFDWENFSVLDKW